MVRMDLHIAILQSGFILHIVRGSVDECDYLPVPKLYPYFQHVFTRTTGMCSYRFELFMTRLVTLAIRHERTYLTRTLCGRSCILRIDRLPHTIKCLRYV